MDPDQLYEALLQPIEGRMMRIVARIVRDPEDAADVFHEVLVTIWHKLETICAHPKPHGYILRARLCNVVGAVPSMPDTTAHLAEPPHGEYAPY